ncbi:hypothetical protein SAY86_029695 [Trapa natans]|uniref:Uncharacterized protein n=1 Tax=Trapa natans TaxID=22666 RepID=A0AAN7M432_TRANT|nr:hypothetical protein SAY86_029695 [Trapa natans]
MATSNASSKLMSVIENAGVDRRRKEDGSPVRPSPSPSSWSPLPFPVHLRHHHQIEAETFTAPGTDRSMNDQREVVRE